MEPEIILAHLPAPSPAMAVNQWTVDGFKYRAKLLLTRSHRQYLYGILQEYHLTANLNKLMQCLRAVLDTPMKLDLLADIRHFLLKEHLAAYDRLAPYHKMAHPLRPINMINATGSLHRPKTVQTQARAPGHTSLPSTPQLRVRTIKTPDIHHGISPSSRAMQDVPPDVMMITIERESDEPLGLSVRGGSEHGLGVFVSEVESHSAADRANVHPGDKILEVNNVSFEKIASSSAVKVLTGSTRLKMVLRRMGKIPAFRAAHEKISWYDVSSGQLDEGGMEEHGTLHRPTGLGYAEGLVERRVHISLPGGGESLGLNIRGGSEYGLGIYVSKVDSGGVANENGVRVGDQIVEANSHSFNAISHATAVEILKTSHQQLMLLLRDVGKYPAFKEIYAEYQWVNVSSGTVSRTRSAGHINSLPVDTSPHSEDVIVHHSVTQFPMESHVEAYVQTDDESDDDILDLPGDDGTQYSLRDMKVSSREASSQLAPRNGLLAIRTDHVAGSQLQEDAKNHVVNAKKGSSVRKEPLKEGERTTTTADIVIPKQSDVLMRQHPDLASMDQETRHHAGLSHSQKSPSVSRGSSRRSHKSPKSTMAVRAMELETRKQYPELAKNVPLHTDEEKHQTWTGKDEKKMRSFSEKIFGSKARSKFKSASHDNKASLF